MSVVYLEITLTIWCFVEVGAIILVSPSWWTRLTIEIHLKESNDIDKVN